MHAGDGRYALRALDAALLRRRHRRRARAHTQIATTLLASPSLRASRSRLCDSAKQRRIGVIRSTMISSSDARPEPRSLHIARTRSAALVCKR
jgi:hypothetical protein